MTARRLAAVRKPRAYRASSASVGGYRSPSGTVRRRARAGAAMTRVFTVTRAGYGAAQLLLAARLAGPGDRPAARRLVRVLGARHLAQAALTGPEPTTGLLALGAEADLLHAATMLALAATRPRYRTRPLIDAAVCACFALAALTARPRPRPYAPGPARPRRPRGRRTPAPAPTVLTDCGAPRLPSRESTTSAVTWSQCRALAGDVELGEPAWLPGWRAAPRAAP
jgi:hypothetical protein